MSDMKKWLNLFESENPLGEGGTPVLEAGQTQHPNLQALGQFLGRTEMEKITWAFAYWLAETANENYDRSDWVSLFHEGMEGVSDPRIAEEHLSGLIEAEAEDEGHDEAAARRAIFQHIKDALHE